MKKFVQLKQTFSVMTIMEIDENETDEQIMARINKHLANNGGADTVICCDGKISFDITNKQPTKEDEDSFECID